jgi:hypothetical protein
MIRNDVAPLSHVVDEIRIPGNPLTDHKECRLNIVAF